LGVLGQKGKAPQPQRPQQTGEQSSGEGSKEGTTPTNEDYLKRELHYSDAKLLDSDNNAVMMGMTTLFFLSLPQQLASHFFRVGGAADGTACQYFVSSRRTGNH